MHPLDWAHGPVYEVLRMEGYAPPNIPWYSFSLSLSFLEPIGAPIGAFNTAKIGADPSAILQSAT